MATSLARSQKGSTLNQSDSPALAGGRSGVGGDKARVDAVHQTKQPAGDHQPRAHGRAHNARSVIAGTRLLFLQHSLLILIVHFRLCARLRFGRLRRRRQCLKAKVQWGGRV